MISVIIPTYNGEKYIGKTLESLYTNDEKIFEVIVVIDGSTDNTEEIVNKFQKQHKNLKKIIQKNGGSSSARNNGLKNAIGTYIMFCDDDDEYEPHLIDNLKKELNKEIDFLAFGRMDVNQNQKIICTPHQEYKTYHNAKAYLTQRFCTGIGSFTVTNKVFQKNIIDKYHIKFDETLKYSEDLDFNLCYLTKIKRTIVEDFRIHYIRYCNIGSLMYRKIPDFFVKQMEILEKILHKEEISEKKEMKTALISHFALVALNRLMSGIDENNRPYKVFKKEFETIYFYIKQEKIDVTFPVSKKNRITQFCFNHHYVLLFYFIFVIIGDVIRKRR